MRTPLLLAALAAAVTGAAAAPAAQAHGVSVVRRGACYVRTHTAARWSHPPGPHGAWRLSEGPGGPVWCFVSVPGGAPVLIRPGHDGWRQVPCPPKRRHVVRHTRKLPCRPVRHHHHARPKPHRVCCVRPVVHKTCCLLPTTPPPPPVVIYPAPNPAQHYGAPGVHVLSWPGKTG